LAKTNKKQERIPNPPEEATGYPRVTIHLESSDLAEVGGVRGVDSVTLAQHGGRIRPARSAELFTLAVANGDTLWITFLGPDRGRGSGDTDSGDGEECREELSGEQHRC
jgi:hypothetical protein